MPNPAPQGRPRKPPESILLPVSLRLSREQLATLRFYGHDWLRSMLDDSRPADPAYAKELREVARIAKVAHARDRHAAELAAQRRRGAA